MPELVFFLFFTASGSPSFPQFVAFMFNSCSEKKGAGAEVCLVQKRGWLKSNGKHLVRNMKSEITKVGPGGKLRGTFSIIFRKNLILMQRKLEKKK